MYTWVASTFCLLWIMLLWTLVYEYLFRFLLLLIFLGIYLIVKLLSHMIILFDFLKTDFFWRCHHNVFHSGYTIFPPALHKGSSFSTFSPILFWFFFFIITILMGAKWYILVALFVSLMMWYWVPFNVFIGYLFVFFAGASVQILCPLLN